MELSYGGMAVEAGGAERRRGGGGGGVDVGADAQQVAHHVELPGRRRAPQRRRRFDRLAVEHHRRSLLSVDTGRSLNTSC